MKIIPSLLLPLTLALGLGACSSDVVSDFEKIVDKACACEDQACLDKVEEEAKKMQDKYPKDEISEDDMKELMKLGEKLRKCEDEIKSAEEEG